MNLEEDASHGKVPVPYERESEGFKEVNGGIRCNIPPTAEVHDAVGTASDYVGPLETSKPGNLGLRRRVRVRHSLIFCWSALFALLSVLAIVAAGVAGSVAIRRGKHIDACMNMVQNLKTQLDANVSSPANTSIAVNSTDGANSTCQNSNSSTFIATSDCRSLISPFTPPTGKLGPGYTDPLSFDLYCGTDFYSHNADFMSFVAFTFEDCLAACATFNIQSPGQHENLTCYGASFNLDTGGNWGSCYLKRIRDIGRGSNGRVDSASLITN